MIWYVPRYICCFSLESRDLQSRPVIRSTAFHLLLLPAQWSCAMGTTMVASSEFPGAVFLCRISSFYWNILVVICQYLLFISNFSKRKNCIVSYHHFLECIAICIVSPNLPMHRNYDEWFHSLTVSGLFLLSISLCWKHVAVIRLVVWIMAWNIQQWM